jgi:hypothetical protein
MKRICDNILSLWVSQNETTISEEISAKISAHNHLHKLWEEEEYKKRVTRRGRGLILVIYHYYQRSWIHKTSTPLVIP